MLHLILAYANKPRQRRLLLYTRSIYIVIASRYHRSPNLHASPSSIHIPAPSPSPSSLTLFPQPPHFNSLSP